jgi:hypothetical protein
MGTILPDTKLEGGQVVTDEFPVLD